MKKLILIAFAILLSSCSYAYAQCPAMPVGFVCITQATANAAAADHRELDATKEALKARDQALVDKDKIIEANKAVAAKNEADLKAALVSTQTELATKVGTLIGCEANQVRNAAIIDTLLKNAKPKKIGLIVF